MQYGKDDKLYPKDVATRALVDTRLYFDMGTFYKAVGDIMYPQMFAGSKNSQTFCYGFMPNFPLSEIPSQADYDRVKEVLGWVTDMIKPTGYVAGTNHMTLADIAFVATISTALATGDVVVNMPKIANHTKNAYRSL